MGYDMEMEEYHDDNEAMRKELEQLQKEIMEEAKKVVEDYSKNPSEISGSVVEVNQNSPFLEENFKGDSWKKVIVGSVDDAIDIISKKSVGKKKKK
tara:strand:+ start:117 stop:404 length:288 start_codon:yes stop_codon:yes gene_type:complete